jgi:alpha-1,2-mannosyltransferase
MVILEGVDYRRVFRASFRTFFFAALPLVLVGLIVEVASRNGTLALDFHNAFWPAGRSVLRGNFAYDPSLRGGDPFVYPPLTAVLLTPVAALPLAVAGGLYTALGILCVPFALWSFGVKDWRCYGVAFLWAPVLSAVQAGNLTLLLVGGLGLAWRVRGRTFALALVVAVLVSAKLFLWPVFLWLLFTRRYRAKVESVLLFVVLNAAAWIAVGAGSIVAYVHLLHRLTLSEASDSYALKAVMGRTGLPSTAGTAVTCLAVLALLATWWKVGRGDDRATLAAMTLVALVASPIVWLHYLALLLAPVALMQRSLNWLWLVPIAAVFCPGAGSGTTLQATLGFAVIAVVAIGVVAPAARPGAATPVWRPTAGEAS